MPVRQWGTARALWGEEAYVGSTRIISEFVDPSLSGCTRRSARRHLHNLRAGSSLLARFGGANHVLARPAGSSPAAPLKRLCPHRDAREHGGSPATLMSSTPHCGDGSPGYFRRREAITGLRGARAPASLALRGPGALAGRLQPLGPGARTPRPPESARGARIALCTAPIHTALLLADGARARAGSRFPPRLGVVRGRARALRLRKDSLGHGMALPGHRTTRAGFRKACAR
ncbi:hypothetical protein HYPSUDRAFT_203180 [Hypholoma sublateritium FD-334 SS-4]|uniref:Uncharacterized protein n=1 Tax=Hypholoma sublateritium (strain FD-334 SS-4) TaxID=945553 RepID=A0A0D2L395_HYPSF|nr:hypothetical protein HYPSUDRAFT_203180 [Hypholoma sublateritium FD-334 SS-4]